MCFGKEPLTIFDLLTQGNVPSGFKTAGTGDSAELDTDFYETLRARVTDLTQWDIEQADERSREASVQKDIDQSAARSTLFQMQVGDTVSYEGRSVTILKLTGPPAIPITAEIELPDRTTKKVRYDTLRCDRLEFHDLFCSFRVQGQWKKANSSSTQMQMRYWAQQSKVPLKTN